MTCSEYPVLRKDCEAEPSHHVALKDLEHTSAPTTEADLKGKKNRPVGSSP